LPNRRPEAVWCTLQLAAIANVIYHATGVRMRQLPMIPGKALEALWAQQSNGHLNPDASPHGATSVERK